VLIVLELLREEERKRQRDRESVCVCSFFVVVFGTRYHFFLRVERKFVRRKTRGQTRCLQRLPCGATVLVSSLD
jgi:hypothetical protein